MNLSKNLGNILNHALSSQGSAWFCICKDHYNRGMGKRRIGQVVVLLLSAILLLAPVYECFDHWDGFPRSGNDTALNLIAAVTFCGVVLVADRYLFRALTERRLVKHERWNPPPASFAFVACPIANESPPLPFTLSLRV